MNKSFIKKIKKINKSQKNKKSLILNKVAAEAKEFEESIIGIAEVMQRTAKEE